MLFSADIISEMQKDVRGFYPLSDTCEDVFAGVG